MEDFGKSLSSADGFYAATNDVLVTFGDFGGVKSTTALDFVP